MRTTFEMDGLFTEEDIKNRNNVMLQCRQCRRWTRCNDYNFFNKCPDCSNCGANDYDKTHAKSLRTYRPLVDNKRKPK